MQIISLVSLLAFSSSSTTATSSKSEDHSFQIDFKPGKKGLVIEVPKVVSLGIGLRGQLLYTIQKGVDVEQSLQLRRARVLFRGWLLGEHNEYEVDLAFSPQDVLDENSGPDGDPQTSPLLDLFVCFTYLRDLTLQVGQYKVPYNRERIISSANLNLVDRSIVDSEFTFDRDIGAEIFSKDLLGLGYFRYYFGISVGEGRNTTDFANFGNLYLLRAEVLPFGIFDDDTEPDLKRNEHPKLSIGIAYAFLDDGKRNKGILGQVPSDGGTTDTQNVTGDLTFFWHGFSVLAALCYRDGKRDPPEGATDVARPRNAWGYVVQPAYLLPWFDLEIAARYARIIPFGDSGVTLNNELGGGLNYYFHGQAMKLQADFRRLWRTNDIGDGTDVFRLQLQLML